MAFASSIADSNALNILREFDADTILCDAKKCRVGRGSFGRVFVGKHEKTGYVAIKSLSVKGGEHEQLLLEQKFCHGYSMLLQSRHDNISVVHGYTKWPGAIGIVMQFYGGGNLRVLLLNDRIELGHGLILRMAAETASAVAYIHNCGTKKRLVHENIRPENIFITHDLHCVIGDYGFASLAKLTAATSTQLLGQPQGITLYYTAPEKLFTFARPNIEQDTYSCGMVYFVMLAREDPYQSEYEFWQKIRQGLRPNVEPIHELKEESTDTNREIMGVMEDVMVRCWDQDPKQRPDMVSVRDTFQQLLSQQDRALILRQVANAASNMHVVDPVATHNPDTPLHLLSSQTWEFHGPKTGLNVLNSPSNQEQSKPPEQMPKSLLEISNNLREIKLPDSPTAKPQTNDQNNFAALHSSHQSPEVKLDTAKYESDAPALKLPPGNETASSSKLSGVTTPQLVLKDKNLSQTPSRNETGFLVIGGYSGLFSGRACLQYDVNTRKYQDLPDLNFVRCKSTSSRIGNWVYVVGGSGNEESCEMIDLRSKLEWVKAADVLEPRHSAASCVVQDQLYVSGGVGERDVLSSCLTYDTVEDRWIESVPMSKPRSNHGMCSINNSLYIIGGSNKFTSLTSCEFRDVRVKRFSAIASLNEGKLYLSCAALEGKLYAIGRNNNSSTVEQYIPEANKWRYVAPLPTPRYQSSVCSVGNQIFVVGGMTNKFGNMMDSKIVEFYDPTDGWSVWGELRKSVSIASVVAI